ncbi:efflux RND transporter periplasmic adaptor subunit [Nocardioides pocheonensis]|nr:efflux RND transporter periplasmic adaptor subunit [Nocardioides pocheonensis]
MFLVVLVAVAAGGWIWLNRGDAAAAQRITATVARGTYKTTVSATGTITPKRLEDLSFSSSGTVTDVAVAVGDKVQKGDVLARIGTASLQAQVDAAEAQLTAAEAQLSDDSSASSTQRAADRASIASAQSDLAQARDALDEATMRAPFSGTVSAVGYHVGDTVGSSSGAPTANGSSDSTAAITVISPRALEVDANVSAADVAKLKKGMQVEITPTGGGDPAYGTVSEVGVIATASDSGAAQFPVTVDVTGKPSGLYAGSTADLAITIKQATDVLAVSTAALHMDGDQPYVYVVEGTKRTRRNVEVGETYGAQTEIRAGLEEGDVVELVSFTAPRGSNKGNGGTNEFRVPGGGSFGGNGPGGNQPPVLIQQGG